MKGRVALVTGANKGIGLEIVRKLHKSEANMTVLLGARNEELGQKAVESFNDSHVLFIKLDLNSHDTITRAAHHVKENYGGLDILVNNAGLAFHGDSWGVAVARSTIETNYFGTKKVCEAFLPLMRPHGRVVNVSSEAGLLRMLRGDIRTRFEEPNLKVEQLDLLVNSFVESVQNNTYAQKGFPRNTYAVSKVF
eukprot:TRINITY_DN2291_c0_g1_i2.p1 TRINITY_DN2291_c0_g1~~TRINITY_DN2291_c0_g1_i2.p1  ORF type:complete len:194 (-),score=35.05 TRINITY_DN2291_c0_g1_i2:503-1084(-)